MGCQRLVGKIVTRNINRQIILLILGVKLLEDDSNHFGWDLRLDSPGARHVSRVSTASERKGANTKALARSRDDGFFCTQMGTITEVYFSQGTSWSRSCF